MAFGRGGKNRRGTGTFGTRAQRKKRRRGIEPENDSLTPVEPENDSLTPGMWYEFKTAYAEEKR